MVQNSGVLIKPSDLNNVQICFLRCILGTDKTTSSPAVTVETGIHSLHNHLITKVSTYRQRIHSTDPDRFPEIYSTEWISVAQPNFWINQLSKVISQRGFSTQHLLSMASRAREIFKQRLLDISAQTDMELLAKDRSLHWLAKNTIIFQPEKYLSLNLIQSLRKAYSRARYELLDAMAKYGHFHPLPYFDRTGILRHPSH